MDDSDFSWLCLWFYEKPGYIQFQYIIVIINIWSINNQTWILLFQFLDLIILFNDKNLLFASLNFKEYYVRRKIQKRIIIHYIKCIPRIAKSAWVEHRIDVLWENYIIKIISECYLLILSCGKIIYVNKFKIFLYFDLDKSQLRLYPLSSSFSKQAKHREDLVISSRNI